MWGLVILMVFQLLGSLLAAWGVGLPGPVLGMLLLLGALLLLGRVPKVLQTTSAQLLTYLPLMLIPPAVGIMDQWAVLAEHALALSVALVGSLCVSLPLTAWIMQKLILRQGQGC